METGAVPVYRLDAGAVDARRFWRRRRWARMPFRPGLVAVEVCASAGPDSGLEPGDVLVLQRCSDPSGAGAYLVALDGHALLAHLAPDTRRGGVMLRRWRGLAPQGRAMRIPEPQRRRLLVLGRLVWLARWVAPVLGAASLYLPEPVGGAAQDADARQLRHGDDFRRKSRRR